MKPFMKHAIATTLLLAVLLVAALAIFVQSGIYNFAADAPHTAFVFSLLERMRDRSVDTRSSTIKVPDLASRQRIVQGAGNYNAMCAQCHLAPGMGATELSKGLYPSPPNLAQEPVDAAHAFWVIKHGVKASGMPAWGKSMQDDYIWNMTAFLRALPKLDAAGYRSMVAESGGHSHGGDESDGVVESHHHGSEEMDQHHDHQEAPDAHGLSAAPAGAKHIHSDGKQHKHIAKGDAK
ncbi:MAG: cytochrome c [Pseudomonadota bacterium]|nr:cytochrome c [Pseudomonadota bacterium]